MPAYDSIATFYREMGASTLNEAATWGNPIMVQYIQTMMRKEPITFAVMILMVAILVFGAWDTLHTIKR